MNLRSVRTRFLLERKREREREEGENIGSYSTSLHQIKAIKRKIYHLLILSSMGTGAPHQNIKVHVLIPCASCHYLIVIIGFLFLLKSGHLLSE